MLNAAAPAGRFDDLSQRAETDDPAATTADARATELRMTEHPVRSLGLAAPPGWQNDLRAFSEAVAVSSHDRVHCDGLLGLGCGLVLGVAGLVGVDDAAPGLVEG